MKLFKILICLLIIFFIYLIIYQTFFTKKNILEGLANDTSGQYQDYNTSNSNNPQILAQQNAGNIQVLEKQINNLNELPTKVNNIESNLTTISTQLSSLQQQVTALTNQQKTAANTVSQKLSSSGENTDTKK